MLAGLSLRRIFQHAIFYPACTDLGIDAARICQIPGLTPASLAAILAETGDLRQYDHPPRWSSMPGCPRPATSPPASAAGQDLRRPARAAAGCLAGDLGGAAALRRARRQARRPDQPRPGPARHGQARVACAASLLRWIWSLIVHGTRWDPGSPPASSATTTPWPLTQAGPPPRPSGPLSSAGSEPASPPGTTPLITQGSSPAPCPGPLTSPVERCRDPKPA